MWTDINLKPNGPYWHYGGQITWGPEQPEQLLYVGMGDQYQFQAAQAPNSYAGCIIRMHRNGTVPSGNLPSSIKPPGCWAYGIRNPYRAHWDVPTNRLYLASVGGNDGTSWEGLYVIVPCLVCLSAHKLVMGEGQSV